MDRLDVIREFIRKSDRGIEIGPYFCPIVPKAQGWKVLSLDVFDAPTLRKRAADDPNIPKDAISRIEDVDLLGPAHHLKDLVTSYEGINQLDFIVSSHNFEHLPNPIGFLGACSEVLRPGGILSMAIPDKRTCFDYFRPLSTLAAMLDAYFEKRERPTAAQVFEMNSLTSRYRVAAGDLVGFDLADDPTQVAALQMVEEADAAWKARIAKGPDDRTYEDCHCWTFTPSSFRLLLLDLRFLGYIEFEPIKIYETRGNEFYVHLRNTRGTTLPAFSRLEYYEERQKLLHAANWDSSANAMGPSSPWGRPNLPDRSATEQARTEVENNAQSEGSSPSDYEALQQEVSRLEHNNAALRQSTSWRITAPLRLIASKLRGQKIP